MQLALWPGADAALRSLIEEVNAPDRSRREAQLRRVGGCAHPLHLRGATRGVDRATGRVNWEYSSREAPGGVTLARCGNRRASVCPSCSRLYQGDTFHLVRAGLAGGKGMPATVAQHPRVFATLTAPGFGAVHTYRPTDPSNQGTRRGRGRRGRGGVCEPRRTPPCPHQKPTACWAHHSDNDPALGTPLCADCYDYAGAVVWQASVGTLWSRFRTYLPRHLATAGRRSRAEVQATVRLSFVKIVEYQKRGLVHVHAVIRADGIDHTHPRNPHNRPENGPARGAAAVPPPAWVTPELLCRAVLSAADAVTVRVNGVEAGSWTLRWGAEKEVRPIDSTQSTGTAVSSATWSGTGAGSRGAVSEQIASYVAKYATKGTEATGWDSRSVRNLPPDQAGPQAAHAVTMVRTAIELSEMPELAGLRLGRWAKELAYRGHVSSKSRQYSTTLGELREARRSHGRDRAQRRRANRPDVREERREELRVESSWRVVGHGLSPGASLLARGIARDARTNADAAREATRDDHANLEPDW